MDVQELIKRGYRALGLGADDDVLAMFDQLGGEPAHWAVYAAGAFGRRHPAGESWPWSCSAACPPTSR